MVARQRITTDELGRYRAMVEARGVVRMEMPIGIVGQAQGVRLDGRKDEYRQDLDVPVQGE